MRAACPLDLRRRQRSGGKAVELSFEFGVRSAAAHGGRAAVRQTSAVSTRPSISVNDAHARRPCRSRHRRVSATLARSADHRGIAHARASQILRNARRAVEQGHGRRNAGMLNFASSPSRGAGLPQSLIASGLTPTSTRATAAARSHAARAGRGRRRSPGGSRRRRDRACRRARGFPTLCPRPRVIAAPSAPAASTARKPRGASSARSELVKPRAAQQRRGEPAPRGVAEVEALGHAAEHHAQARGLRWRRCRAPRSCACASRPSSLARRRRRRRTRRSCR